MTPSDRQLGFALGRIAAALRAGLWQSAGAQGLVPAQAEILLRIARQAARPGEIAAHLGVSAASASDSIAGLVAKGLVARVPDPQDRRARRLVPTEAGKRLAETLADAPTALLGAIAALSPQDQGGLLRALTLLIRALQDVRAIPVQRMCATCRHFRPRVHADPERPHHCAFVNAAFGDADLRLDCGEHEAAPAEEAAAMWRRFEAA